jgi:hypothetical protein
MRCVVAPIMSPETETEIALLIAELEAALEKRRKERR